MRKDTANCILALVVLILDVLCAFFVINGVCLVEEAPLITMLPSLKKAVAVFVISLILRLSMRIAHMTPPYRLVGEWL